MDCSGDEISGGLDIQRFEIDISRSSSRSENILYPGDESSVTEER